MKNALILEEGHYCFACGKQNPAGLSLVFSFRDGRVQAEFTLRKQFQGYKDIVHGGIVAAILDEAMIKAALAQGVQAVTAEITVRFKSPLYIGERATVVAEIRKRGERLLEAQAHIEGADSRVVAEGKGKLYIRKRTRP